MLRKLQVPVLAAATCAVLTLTATQPAAATTALEPKSTPRAELLAATKASMAASETGIEITIRSPKGDFANLGATGTGLQGRKANLTATWYTETDREGYIMFTNADGSGTSYQKLHRLIDSLESSAVSIPASLVTRVTDVMTSDVTAAGGTLDTYVASATVKRGPTASRAQFAKLDPAVAVSQTLKRYKSLSVTREDGPDGTVRYMFADRDEHYEVTLDSAGLVQRLLVTDSDDDLGVSWYVNARGAAAAPPVARSETQSSDVVLAGLRYVAGASRILNAGPRIEVDVASVAGSQKVTKKILKKALRKGGWTKTAGFAVQSVTKGFRITLADPERYTMFPELCATAQVDPGVDNGVSVSYCGTAFDS